MTMLHSEPFDFWSASQLARRLDLNEKRVLGAIRDGRIVPDGTGAGRIHFFKSDRLAAIRQILTGNQNEVLA